MTGSNRQNSQLPALNGIIACSSRSGLRLLLASLLALIPCLTSADVQGTGKFNEARQLPASATGVEEHLGAKIPLGLAFRDETGKTVTLAELITGPTIILPVYYRCANVCSVLQASMVNALQKLEQKAVTDYRVISISFNERETPEMAARSKQTYLSAFRKPFPEGGWRFLTGDLSSIRQLTGSIGFFFERRGEDFAHPVISIMVAKDGTIIRYLYGVTVLPKDLALAITEARSGITGTSIRKVMDYCFTFDPTGKTYVFNLLKVSATAVILSAGGFLVFLIITGRKRAIVSRRKNSN